MAFAETLFWISLLSLLYTYVGYGILVSLFVSLGLGRKRIPLPDLSGHSFPRVFFVITAYNEAGVIRDKLANTLSLDYPADRLRICVNADGSTDGTDTLAASHGGVMVLHRPKRLGKAAAMNRSVEHCGDAEILVFSDANTMLANGTLMMLIRRYADPLVGAVSGEKRVSPGSSGKVQAIGESVYWRYESMMKALDARFHTLVGAAGEILSVRKDLFRPIPVDTILDDLQLSLDVCLQGRVVDYEPDAFALEDASVTLAGEWERKVRIGAGAFQSLGRFGLRLLRGSDLRTWFQFLSRRFMRWVICPIALPVLLVSNVLLAWGGGIHAGYFRILLGTQLIFHAFAWLGALMSRNHASWARMFQLPFYFLFMHYAQWAGFFRWARGRQSVKWDKSGRSGASI